MWKLAAFVLLALVLTAGVRPTANRTETGTGYSIVFLSDCHGDGPIGGNANERQRLRRMVAEINADASIVGVVVAGDFATGGWDVTDTTNTSMIDILDGLNCPWYPAVGNHDWAAADTATGHLYDDFIGYCPPATLSEYIGTGHRGRRWYSATPTLNGYPVTASIFALNNNRVDTTFSGSGDGYYRNNPRDGSGVAVDDFDGISDSTSTQRVDLKRWLRGLSADALPILVQHRSYSGITSGPDAGRPDQEGRGNADSCQVTWVDDNWDGLFLVFDGDEHAVKAQDMGTFVVFSASNAKRSVDTTRLADWSSETLMFALSDTAWTDTPGVAMADSIGDDADVQPNLGTFGSYQVIARVDVEPDSARLVFRMIQNEDATCTVDSLVFAR